MSAKSETLPQIRLCHLLKWPDFDGYGFNLHAEKGVNGQFIGQVDPDSPAESAGLREGDRIVEVNGVNIGQENHRQVVERIKAIPNETKLLVVDAEADRYYRARKQNVKQSTPGVLRLKTAVPRPTPPSASVANGKADDNGNGKEIEASANDTDRDGGGRGSTTPQSSGSTVNNHRKLSSTGSDDKLSHHSSSSHSSPFASRKDGSLSSKSSGTAPRDSPTALTPPLTPVPRPASQSDNSTDNGDDNGHGTGASNGNALNLNMTAQQMRAMLANRKKYDPKKETMDLRKKHAIIQQM